MIRIQILLGCFAVLLFSGFGNPQPKVPDYKGTYKQLIAEARTSGKNIMLVFGANWCPPCQIMDESTFQDEDLGLFMSSKALLYKVDVDKHSEIDTLRKLFPVTHLPTTFFVNPKGEILQFKVGYLRSQEIKDLLDLLEPPSGTIVSQDYLVMAAPTYNVPNRKSTRAVFAQTPTSGQPSKKIISSNSGSAPVRVKVQSPAVPQEFLEQPNDAFDLGTSALIETPTTYTQPVKVALSPNYTPTPAKKIVENGALTAFAIQVGAYAIQQGAMAQLEATQLAYPNVKPRIFKRTDAQGKTLFHVLLTGFTTQQQAILEKNALGVSGFVTDTQRFR